MGRRFRNLVNGMGSILSLWPPPKPRRVARLHPDDLEHIRRVRELMQRMTDLALRDPAAFATASQDVQRPLRALTQDALREAALPTPTAEAWFRSTHLLRGAFESLARAEALSERIRSGQSEPARAAEPAEPEGIPACAG
jgi:hypothetical protein